MDRPRQPPEPVPGDGPDRQPQDPSGLGPQGERQLNLLERYDLAQRTEGVLAAVLTVVLAFLAGGIVVLITTGKNPLDTYKAIFEGSGLNYLLPWISSDDRFLAELNLQQTLLITTPLILTGLAVAFAFRCGMFNIGGQGQYFAGAIFAVWIGSSFPEMNPFLHILLATVIAVLAGAAWAGIAGILKATVGVHEVISTIMLNWIAIYVGSFLFGLGGPLQNDTQESVPISNDIVESAKLHVFWGDPLLQGLSIGIFVSLAALIVYWILLNRTTLGYSVRAVGFNPEGARYGGINVSRNYFLAMAISGAFAGLAGALDILGWQFRLSTSDIQTSAIGFTGIAVALLGRNTAVGVGLSALLFGALLNGTSTRNLDPEIFQPELASNLTLLIQGLVVLFVGADVIILTLLSKLRRRGRRQERPPSSQPSLPTAA
jgi:simple sugar transport system permease protein